VNKQEEIAITAEDLEKYLQAIQNNDNSTQAWYDASEFPALAAIRPETEDLDKYIENALAHSHKWKDHKDVKITMDGIDLKDQIVRVNCKYIRNLYFRLGKASDPHLEIAKSHGCCVHERGGTSPARKSDQVSNRTIKRYFVTSKAMLLKKPRN
jgi:hypothetical protein